MKLKIKPEHYALLQSAISATLAKHPVSRETYLRRGFSPKRFRWDLLYASQIDGVPGNLWICREIYPYANDEHIDSALRAIVRTK
jgi:hypothetical protein